MKVYRIDTDYGEYYTLTEKELNEQFTKKEIQEFQDDKETIFYVMDYTVRQLNRARTLHSNQDYCWNFEEEHETAPSVLDILEHLYS